LQPNLLKTLFIILLLLIIGNQSAMAQNDSIAIITNDTLSIISLTPDSGLVTTDSVSADTINRNENALQFTVDYSADDSMIYDLETKEIYLYGNASVKYDNIDLKAAKINYNAENFSVSAEGVPDSIGKMVSTPIFKEGEQQFDATSMKYNFKSKKGFIKDVRTAVAEGHLFGKTVKTTADNKVIYIKDGEYCPCEDPEAHTRFKISKLKVIKDDKIVTGPGYMTIWKVPTPIAFPFGFFPNTTKQQSGILIPQYGDGGDRGFFLINGGYYQPLGEHIDTKILGDIYTRGSWALKNLTRYKKIYKFDGNFNVDYNIQKINDQEFPNYEELSNFFVRWTHSQDPKARPDSRFSASVNAGSSQNFRNNLNTSQNNFLNNTFNSSITYSKNFPGRPFSFNAAARHSQNSLTRNFDFTLPSASFNVSRIFLPLSFLRQNDAGSEKWFEKIGLNYTSDLTNNLSVSESQLKLNELGKLTDDFKNGIQHASSLSTSLKAWNFSINPSLSLTDKMYFSTIRKEFIGDTLVVRKVDGFKQSPDFSFSTSASTKVFGMYRFNSNKIKAVRHVITPSATYSYTPGLAKYESYIDTAGNRTEYSIYDEGIYGSTSELKRQSIGLALINNVEMKVATRKDTASDTRILKILENLSVNSGYNILADSVKWSDLAVSMRTPIYKTIGLVMSGSYSPYSFNQDGKNINESLLKDRGRLLRMNRISGNIDATLQSKNTAASTTKETENISEEDLEFIENNKGLFVDFTVPWSLNFNYQAAVSKTYQAILLPTQKRVNFTQSVIFNGDLRLFERVKIGFNSGYDFQLDEFTTTNLNLYIDLNCWEFTAGYIPFGLRKSYNFAINIKTSILKDLKIQKRGNLGDEFNTF
jgi:lipopolysaccharide assembly outer membrane protein LptD (OstA)